jgi:hypothetical protein
MTAPGIVLSSLSAAMDGGFTAIADVSAAVTAAGAAGGSGAATTGRSRPSTCSSRPTGREPATP